MAIIDLAVTIVRDSVVHFQPQPSEPLLQRIKSVTGKSPSGPSTRVPEIVRFLTLIRYILATAGFP